MIIYIETNFILELALMQEEHEFCEHIVSLCVNGQHRLVVPAYSLAEPYETLTRRTGNRRQLAETVKAELRQLGRSTPYQAETDAHQAIVDLLLRSGSEERQRLSAVQQRLLDFADVIPLDAAILSAASIYEKQHNFSPQDAIVYASVLHHLEANDTGDKCFLNKNSKDFSDPDIETSLAAYNCKIIFNFRDGFNYISSFQPHVD